MGGGDATRRSTTGPGTRAPARAGYAAGIVWALACLGLYVWQLIGLAGG